MNSKMRSVLQAMCSVFHPSPKSEAFTSIVSRLIDERKPVLLRPSNPRQKALMLEKYMGSDVKALSNGGYVFVSRADAPMVVTILVSQSISYELVPLEQVSSHLGPDPASLLAENKVMVVIDDERVDFEVRDKNFTLVCQWIIDWTTRFIRSADTSVIPELIKIVNARTRVPLIFIDWSLPRKRGVSVIFVQSKRIIAPCILTSLTYADHEVSAALGEITLTDEVRSYTANAVTIVGSGPAHYMDLIGDDNPDIYTVEADRVLGSAKRQKESSFRGTPAIFVKPSKLAFSINEGRLVLIDLER
jgi:hypothetical protein